ncbi:MAG: alpha-rhamnosidase [Cytophagaceae bacterium]|nr:alpha-rhamnosidase [Cytophagaceae bacterium]
MAIKNTIFVLLATALLLSCGKKQKIEINVLQTEHLTTPLGLDATNPRFTWKINAENPSTAQESFHIYVDEDSAAVANRNVQSWDMMERSGRNLVVYEGEPLQPFTKYYWGVEVVDNASAKSTLAISHFETGMLKQENWQGSWITDTNDINLKPAPYFRKDFSPKGKIKEARAYITAAGLYEFTINGEKVGNHRLDPVYTRFDKRNLYVTYDVTQALNKEQVTLGVLLGNGWYNHQSTAVWYFDRAGWRARPRFLLDVRIVYEDGSVETVSTDDSWKTALSPVVFNSIYTAEHYDATREINGWDTPGFDDTAWKPAKIVDAPSQHIVAQAMPPIRNVEEIKPVSMQKLSDKKYIYDLGRNIAGVTQLTVNGEHGTRIWVTHAEQLDSTGNIDLSNIDVHYRPTDTLDPFQTDIYTLNGLKEETFMPHFNYKGFQYMEVKSDKPIQLTQESLKGQFMHSDVEQIGHIQSSNETLNKIWQATNAAYLSNLFGYPTDCPQREKNGWTGDAHINIETGLYNYDAITIYEKWMADHRDEQKPNGVLPSIIPTWGGWGYDWGNGPDWTSTVAIIPWELYQFYGDDRTLELMYKPIKKYVDHITEISYDGGLTNWGLGDWVPVKSVTPKEFTSSIYYYVDALILAKAAQHFDKQADFKKYTALAENIKNAINKKYLNLETGIYGSGFQTELSAPLYWGIVPDELKPLVADNLAKRVVDDGNHIDVGLLGTRTILGALSNNGHADLAYTVAAQETYPSWGWWIKNGATTLYENWDIDAGSDISRNHIMFGTIGGWLYSGLGGINTDEASPGFKNVLLTPHIVDALDSFEARHNGPYGEITSRWEKDGDRVKYTCIIPAGSTATLTLMGKDVRLVNGKSNAAHDDWSKGFVYQIGSGEYTFEISK